ILASLILQVVLLSFSMRHLLLVALVVTLSGLASAKFRGTLGELYSTWDLSKEPIYVKDFDHLAPLRVEKEVHEEEHSRKKRNAAETARFLVNQNPITKACDRPGYTGQYCEFPICLETNFNIDPDQFKQGDGYLVDVADLGNCTKSREIIVDETMFDIRIEIQSKDNVNPRFIITDDQGFYGQPDGELKENDRYEAHFENLKPGYYRVQGQADILTSRCLLQTTAQTGMTISGGFSSDERDRNDFPNRNAAKHEFNSIMVHLNGARSPAELKTISVIGTNNYVFRPRILDKRYGCGYEYYFDSMFCMDEGAYAMIVEGVDFNGNPFRRAANFGCLPDKSQTTTTKAPTTSLPMPTECKNGGVLLNNGKTTSCICQDHWTGNTCEQPLCINGGTLISGKCFCTTGFEGTHCEDVRCEPNSNHGFGVDRPTLVLVVRVREQMNEVMQQVQDAVDQIASNLQFDPNYFSRFQVVYFNDYTNFKSTSYKSIFDFDADFHKATIASHNDGGCTDAVIGAVATGLSNIALTSNSMVYVITDALADDSQSMTDLLMQWNSYFRATINFIYVEPTADSGCQSDISDPGFRAFDNIANSFGGLAMHVSDRTKVKDVFYNHLNSIVYKSQLMLTVDRDECGNGLVKTVMIEGKSENLVLITRGKGFYPLVTNPMGEHLNEDTLTIVVKQDYLTIWRVANPIAGNYYIRMTANPSTASCSLRAYQASFQTPGPPQAEAFWSITTDVDQDGQFYQPLSGWDNHPVFHVENLGEDEDWDHAFSFLNMYTWRNGEEKEIYAANGMYRDGCQYNFYFPSFRCRANEKLHYEFFVRNHFGFYIQRAGVMDCYTYVPTFEPPTECQNGGVMMNETCLCLAHFTGDKCQTVTCENGGTPGFMNQCICPKGWGGPFCAFAVCDNPGVPPTFGYHVDMAFLVEVTKSGVNQIKQLVQFLPGLLRDISSQHADWIDRVVLIGYNSQDVIGMIDAPMGNPQKLLDALGQWADSNPTDDGCVVRVWEAIFQLLRNRQDGPNKRNLPRRSIVNIFESSIPDNQGDAIQALSTSEELLETNALTNVFQWLDSSSDTRWRCGGNQSDFQYIEQAARRGDGKMYTLANDDIPNIIKMIPTLFSSSIVYKWHNEDCASAAQMVYFPIDAYTQTVSAIVAGYNSEVEMYKYTGVIAFPPDDNGLEGGRIDIYKNNMEQIVEWRNLCDDGWQAVSQYCMYFNPGLTVRNYADATGYCNGLGSFLIDDLSSTKDKWISDMANNQKIWLGLQWTNKGWVFQHDDGSTLPVTNNNFWNGGIVPDGSNGKTCAYFDPKATNGNWIADVCTSNYRAVCQKHMHDSNNAPSSIADDDLAPGKYFLKVKTGDMPPGGWRGCDVEVRVQSDLNVEFGFVDGLRKDSPHPVANVDSNDNRVISSISIGQGKTDMSVLQHVLIRADSNLNVLEEAATYSYRVGCSYEYYSQPLNCDLTNGEDFSVVHIGEDDTGNTFQRYSTSLCYKWNICSNGGVYSNGACLCPDYWTGDNCRTPHCQNGQPNTDGKSCKCDDGWGGDVCQFALCSVDSKTQFSNDDKILALVIEKSENTAASIRDLANNFQKIVEAIAAKESKWITTYVLHTFIWSGAVDDTVVLKDVADVVTHLNQFADEAEQQIGSCQQPLWDAFHNLFDQLHQFLKGSEVLVISASAPLDADINTITPTMELFDTMAPTVDFIHIDGVCETEQWMRGLEDFYFFFESTGGTMFRVEPDKIGEALIGFLPTRYAASLLTFQNGDNCQQNTMYIQVDTRMTEVYVTVGGKGGSVSVISPLGEQVQTTPLYSVDEQRLWKIEPGYPGIYSVTISSQSQFCFPAVYGYGGAQIIVGFIQDYTTTDKPLPYAVYGKVNFPVFHIMDRQSAQGPIAPVETLYMANMYVQTVWNKGSKMYDSDIDRRTGCSFEYIGNGFTCANKDSVITIMSSGVDDYNQPFSRESIAWCKSGSTPPPTTSTSKPVSTSTTTGTSTTTPAPTPKTIQFDLLFIVDETEAEDGNERPIFITQVAEPFIEKIMQIYTTSQRKARVGLITMPGKQSKSMPVAFLSSIDSFDALDQNLISLEDFNIPKETEWLDQALQFANDPNKYKKKENGYRAEIDNHLIVILTAKSHFEDIDAALKEIDKISRDGSYGIIAVGYTEYQPTADWSDIKKLAGDCTQIAATKDQLMGDTVDFIQSSIWNATFNGGFYCAPAN
ncbi:hypothetical protein PMAYCL1PPCAC_17790, partial [Pristionchus mayeri]